MTIPFLGEIFGLGRSLVQGWQDRLTQKQRSKLAIEEAKTAARVKRLQSQQDHEHAWELEAAKGMRDSWKDEWFTIVLSLPAIAAFFPPLVPYVAEGFIALESAPEWYRIAFGAAVAASFGLRIHDSFTARKKKAE